MEVDDFGLAENNPLHFTWASMLLQRSSHCRPDSSVYWFTVSNRWIPFAFRVASASCYGGKFVPVNRLNAWGI